MSSTEFKNMFQYLDLNPDGSICDSYLYLTVAELCRANLKNFRPDKKNISYDNKMKDNDKIINKSIVWEAQLDDCKDVLHNIRFERFPLTNSQRLFATASEYYMDRELLATNSYDLSSVEMTNVITSKGIEEAHKPYSREISIKMFSRENFRRNTGGVAEMNIIHNEFGNPTVLSSQHLSDIGNFTQFQDAFFNLYVFKGRATPWDKSLEPLWKFLITHRFFIDNPNSFGFYRDLDQGLFLANFVDRILHCNADRFLHKTFHLSLSEIDAEFKSYCISNSSCTIVQMVPIAKTNSDNVSKSKKSFTRNEPQKKFQLSAPGTTYIPIKSICMRFNSVAGCTNKFDNLSKKCKDQNTGNSFLHICNTKTDTGRPCGQLHAQMNHS